MIVMRYQREYGRKWLKNLVALALYLYDRMLIAQSENRGLIMITADNNIHKYDIDYIWK